MHNSRTPSRRMVSALGALLVALGLGQALATAGGRHGAPAQTPRARRPAHAAFARPGREARRKAALAATVARLPLSFEPNVGQAAAPARFLARGAGYALALDPTGAMLVLASPPRTP